MTHSCANAEGLFEYPLPSPTIHSSSLVLIQSVAAVLKIMLLACPTLLPFQARPVSIYLEGKRYGSVLFLPLLHSTYR